MKFDESKFKELLNRLSQSDIAVKLGVSQPAVSQRLKRLDNLRVREFDAICELAGVDPRDYYDG